MARSPVSFLRSVRGRLFLAFLGISMFSLVAGGAGLYSLAKVNNALNRITEERVPQALALVDVTRQAERILSAAPALLVVTTEVSRVEVAEAIRDEVEKLRSRRSQAETGSDANVQSENSVATLVDKLDRNLLELDNLVSQRLVFTSAREALTLKLQTVNNGALRLIAPAERQLGAQISSWSRSGGADAAELDASQGKIAQNIIGILPQREIATKIARVGSALSNISISESVQEIEVLEFGLKNALSELDVAIEQTPARVKLKLKRLFAAFVDLSEGEDGVPETRKRELIAIGSGKALLEANSSLAKLLTNRIDFLVKNAEAEIAVAKAEAAEVHKLSFNILVAVGVLSLTSSILIVWLYVGRVLIARLPISENTSGSETAFAASRFGKASANPSAALRASFQCSPGPA